MPHSPRPGRGIALLLGALVFFVLMDATAKHLAESWPIPLLAWARYTTHCGLMLLLLAPRLGRGLVDTRRPGRQILRALMLLGTTLTVMMALGHMPLAETTAVAFAAPLLVVMLARPLLGEPISPRRWVAVVLGFGGVLMIARPGSGLSLPGLAYAGAGAIFLAFYHLLTREMAGKENALTMLFYTALVGSLALSAALPWMPAPPQAPIQEWLRVASLGCFGGMGHFLLIKAFREAPASLLSPLTYVQIPLAMLFGWLVFHHAPDAGAMLGMLIITGAGALVAWDGRAART